MWEDYDSSFLYEKIRIRCLVLKGAAKIVEMIIDPRNYRNGDSTELYYPKN